MSDHLIVFIGHAPWRLSFVRDGQIIGSDVLTDSEQPTLESRLASLVSHLAENQNDGCPIVLALASDWCLTATISTEGLPRGDRSAAMAYRLEEDLPISAEEIVADYIDLGNHQALGVCTEVEVLRAIIDALEAAGHAVPYICPAMMIVAGDVIHASENMNAVLVCATREVDGHSHHSRDLIAFNRGEPAQWRWLSDDDAAVRVNLEALANGRDEPLNLCVVGTDTAVAEIVESIQAIQSIAHELDHGDQAAARQAARILDETRSPWINFRRDALTPLDGHQTYRNATGALAVTIAVLLLCISAVSLWRGWQYGALRERYEARQVEVFREVLPDQRVPYPVVRRLRSERQRLEGLGGQATGGPTGTTVPRSALSHLQRVLGSLPDDVRFRILDLDIESGVDSDMIRVSGEARSYAEAERLVVALRERAGYEVTAPETRSLKDRGVSFVFTASPAQLSVQSRGDQR